MIVVQNVPSVHVEDMIGSGETNAGIAGLEATDHESRTIHRIGIISVEALQCLVTLVCVHRTVDA